MSELKKLRHSGKLFNKDKKINFQEKLDDIYDWIVDIDLITNIDKNGWQIKFSELFYNQSLNIINKHIYEEQIDELKKKTSNVSIKDEIGLYGPVVAVVGLYDKGKTFVLNNLSISNLPSGKKVNTKGLSFKFVDIEDTTKMILLDTAGSYSPVRIEDDMSIIEKEATEMFTLEMVFDISDYFLFVVNDFTSLDQRYLDKLSRSLQNSPNKGFREVIVIHNFKEVENHEVLDHIWENQIKKIYANGKSVYTKVDSINPVTGKLEAKNVLWFKSPFSRHVALVNQDSMLGLEVNPWTFSLLRYWLKTVLVPVDRKLSIIDSVMNSCSNKLTSYFKKDLDIKFINSDLKFNKFIKSTNLTGEKLKLPQISIDSSGFVMTRPDSFVPSVDIIKGNEYVIIIDVPGMIKDEIIISRQNVITIVKGVRKRDLETNYSDINDLEFEKNERKFGEFTINFKIPDDFHRKWYFYDVKNGVCTIKYKKDIEEDN